MDTFLEVPSDCNEDGDNRVQYSEHFVVVVLCAIADGESQNRAHFEYKPRSRICIRCKSESRNIVEYYNNYKYYNQVPLSRGPGTGAGGCVVVVVVVRGCCPSLSLWLWLA